MPLHQFADLIPSSHCHVIILWLLSVDASRVLVGGFVVVSCITSSSTLKLTRQQQQRRRSSVGVTGLEEEVTQISFVCASLGP